MVSPQEGAESLEDVPGLDVDENGRAHQAVTLHDVQTEVEELRRVFSPMRVEMLHGKMSARAKDEVIDDFRAGRIDVLVATTVVEVGVDVPNATVMVIENGERFRARDASPAARARRARVAAGDVLCDHRGALEAGQAHARPRAPRRPSQRPMTASSSPRWI